MELVKFCLHILLLVIMFMVIPQPITLLQIFPQHYLIKKMSSKRYVILKILLSLITIFLINCANNGKDNTIYKCVIELENKIKLSNPGDTLDLNLECIKFDHVVILSHEINEKFLQKEIEILNFNQIRKYNSKDGNWSLMWVKDSIIVAQINFSPTFLMA